MSRYGKPIKNKKHKDPRYFLNEEQEQEELELLQENNPLGGDSKTRIPNNPLGGDSKTRTGPEPEDSNPLGGNQKTRIVPQKKNPLGGDSETRTPDNPQGEPLQKRVAKIEKILKQLIAKLK